MRKAVHVTTVHPVSDTRIFYKECLTLRDAGYQVVLIVSGEGPEMLDGIHIRYLPRARDRRHRATVLTQLALQQCLKENADIYHFHDPELMPKMSRLLRDGKPVIYDMHENIAKDMLTKPYIPRILRPLAACAMRLAAKRWLRRMTVIFAERSYRRDYQWLTQSEVVENLPRVDELMEIEAPKADPPMLGYIGSVTELRGSMQMLAAIEQLQQAGVKVGLECVGPATEQHLDMLKQYIDVNQLQQVHLHGRLGPAEGWQLMAGCRIGLALLADIPNYHESFPTKLFEYMGLGLPVIASDFPLYRNIIDRHTCGICVDPTDTDAIADAVRWLLDNSLEASEMGRRGREAVRRSYCWDTEAVKLLALYDSLLLA